MGFMGAPAKVSAGSPINYMALMPASNTYCKVASALWSCMLLNEYVWQPIWTPFISELGFELEKIASELVNEGVPQATSPEAKIAEVPMNSLRDFINSVRFKSLFL